MEINGIKGNKQFTFENGYILFIIIYFSHKYKESDIVLKTNNISSVSIF